MSYESTFNILHSFSILIIMKVIGQIDNPLHGLCTPKAQFGKLAWHSKCHTYS